jgi:hypothetical protein
MWHDTFLSRPSVLGPRDCTKSSSTRLGSAAVYSASIAASDQEEYGVGSTVSLGVDATLARAAAYRKREYYFSTFIVKYS